MRLRLCLAVFSIGISLPLMALADKVLPVEMPEDIDVSGIVRQELEAQGQKLISTKMIFSSNSSMSRYYPNDAIQEKVQGEAAVICQFAYETDGRLKNCVAIYEIPDLYGFGQATIDVVTHDARVDVTQVKPEDKNAFVLLTYKWLMTDVPIFQKK